LFFINALAGGKTVKKCCFFCSSQALSAIQNYCKNIRKTRVLRIND